MFMVLTLLSARGTTLAARTALVAIAICGNGIDAVGVDHKQWPRILQGYWGLSHVCAAFPPGVLTFMGLGSETCWKYDTMGKWDHTAGLALAVLR